MATRSFVEAGGTNRASAAPTAKLAPPATRTPRSRTGGGLDRIHVAAIVLIALIIFIVQNTQPVQVKRFAMRGTVPLAIALLIAGIGVGIVAMTMGTIRIGQLRRSWSLGTTRLTSAALPDVCPLMILRVATGGADCDRITS